LDKIADMFDPILSNPIFLKHNSFGILLNRFQEVYGHFRSDPIILHIEILNFAVL